MKISKIAEILEGKIICAEEKADAEVASACASDMMSDVLAFVKDQAVLVTGLSNPQVVRTAEMMDMKCVVMVRGKCPDIMTVKLAESKGIVIVRTEEKMFEACGKLFAHGLKGS